MRDGVWLRSLRTPFRADAIAVVRPMLSEADIAQAIGRGMLHEGKAHPGMKRGLVRDDAPQPEKDGRLPPYYWAAFVLIGDPN